MTYRLGCAYGVPSCLWCVPPRAYSAHMVHIVHMVHTVHTVPVGVGYFLSHLARADLIKMFGFDQNLI